jgi:SAM-dependent methyltransferase
VEIGSTGRYVSALRSEIRFDGTTYLVNDVAPTNSPVDILERQGVRQAGSWLPLNGYEALPATVLPDGSVDFVSCYVGLHHMTPQTLGLFIRSIARVLRPGGLFVLRDHDVGSPEMFRFVSLIHTIFNAGTGASWESNRDELRYFTSIDEWVRRLRGVGLIDQSARLLQPHDPSLNVLMAFEREAGAA